MDQAVREFHARRCVDLALLFQNNHVAPVPERVAEAFRREFLAPVLKGNRPTITEGLTYNQLVWFLKGYYECLEGDWH